MSHSFTNDNLTFESSVDEDLQIRPVIYENLNGLVKSATVHRQTSLL